jgi:pimeloyl-ACP methyl ester carboxylesterase
MKVSREYLMSANPPEVSMTVEVTGQGSPIVLVPGGLTGWLSWIPHAEQLARTNQVVRVNLLAVELGLKNAPLPPDYSVDYETDALKRTLDDVDVGQADFVAWSYGAEITLNFALNYPERIRTLTLIEPPAIWVLRSRGPLTAHLLAEQEYLQSMNTDDVSEEQLVRFTHFAGFVPRDVDPRGLPQWPTWLKHRQSLRTGDVTYRHQDDIARVRAFDKPVLLFKGMGSSDFLREIIDLLGQSFPNARVEDLPGGHALQLASMPQFMDILARFHGR